MKSFNKTVVLFNVLIILCNTVNTKMIAQNYTGVNGVAEKLRQQNNVTPENSILLIIDHQVGLIPGVRDINPHEYKEKVAALASIAKVFKVPVLLSTSRDTGPNGLLIPEITEILPDVKIIRRPGIINAYAYEPFRKALEATGRKKVIIAAITLETCVLLPTIDMLKDGYDVYPVIDASGSWSKSDAEAAQLRLSKLGANLTTVFSLLCELQYDWRRPTAMDAAGIFKKYLPQYSYTIDAYINYTSEKYKEVPAEWNEKK